MARGQKKETLTPEERLQAALVPESEQPYKVPGNWCWTRIGDILRLQAGKNISSSQISELRSPKAQFPCFGGNGIRGYVERYNRDGEFPIIGRQGALCGNVNWASGKFYATEHAVVVECLSDISKRWAYHILFSMNLNQYATATAQPGLSVSTINQVPIVLPPLPEQRRIVARIESLFAKLDEARQQAQDALDSFEPRKAAILHKAFTGELSAKWRKEHGVGMESWEHCKLIDILVEKPRNGYSPKPVDYVTPYKSMTLSATTTGVFKAEFFKYIDEEIPENSYLWLKPGDILIQRANSLEKVGISAIYTGAEHEFIYPDLMMKLTVKESGDKYYINYYLKTDRVLNYFRSNATGTAGNMPKINQKVVSETPIILPRMQEQTEIVRLLDGLLAKEQQAKEAAEAVLDQIDLIKKAILARAFRGELGTNDPAEESAVELVKEVIEKSTEIDDKPKTKAKRTVIPGKIKSALSNSTEEEIVKLLIKSAPEAVSIQMIMSISKKKFELMDALRNLEQKQIVMKGSSGEYLLKR